MPSDVMRVPDAIMNPAAALQSTAEDFLESLTQTPGASQAELINCVLRICGCNHAVDADEVVDYDGVVDALDNITEALKQVRYHEAYAFPNANWSRAYRMITLYTHLHLSCLHSKSSASPSPSFSPG